MVVGETVFLTDCGNAVSVLSVTQALRESAPPATPVSASTALLRVKTDPEKTNGVDFGR
jgi:hypothetical protein